MKKGKRRQVKVEEQWALVALGCLTRTSLETPVYTRSTRRSLTHLTVQRLSELHVLDSQYNLNFLQLPSPL
jgi:hypothetical protein